MKLNSNFANFYLGQDNTSEPYAGKTEDRLTIFIFPLVDTADWCDWWISRCLSLCDWALGSGLGVKKASDVTARPEQARVCPLKC